MSVPADIASRFAALGVRVRLNRNRRCLVSLRDQRQGPPVLSIHQDLIEHIDQVAIMADLERFVRERGKGDYPDLHLAMQALPAQARTSNPARIAQLRALPRIGSGFDHEACFRAVHARFFAHLPRPFFRWGRDPGARQLKSLRFGVYLRHPHPAVRLSPRLARPWVARLFVEHVLHHELCHHAQACAPCRGEAMHSPRFRAWERSFPEIDEALAWEALHLRQLLGP